MGSHRQPCCGRMSMTASVCLTNQSRRTMQAMCTTERNCQPRLSYAVTTAQESFSQLTPHTTKFRSFSISGSWPCGYPQGGLRFQRAFRVPLRRDGLLESPWNAYYALQGVSGCPE